MARGKPTVRARADHRSNPKTQPDARPEPGTATDVPVVAIGASAGGLEPIGRFLGAMRADSGLAFVVIQHLDPTSKSLLPQLLAKHTAMSVRPAEDGAVLMPNEVSVIPPGVYLSMAGGKLHFAAAEAGRGARMPVDAFLHSLATDRGKRGIGIIMSGTGTDGAQGLMALKEAGGLALVQDPNEAQHDGMPRNAMLTAHPDYVLTVEEMPAVLLRYVSHDYVQTSPMTAGTTEQGVPGQPSLTEFIDVLRSSTGQEFDHYKTGMLQRRIERRMALHSGEDWNDYLALLRQNPAEAQALVKDLLINVTRFFRDPDTYSYLANEVIPRMLSRHSGDQPVRIWVAGCSTGEEAYSLGILVLERIAASRLSLRLQIFATDIDDDALAAARTGIYPESIEADVSATRLDRFFIREGGRFKVVKALRDAVIFSRHNLLIDPPFSQLDLVSCRNVLIYLKPDAQHHVLSLLHFGLRNDGVLLLGSAESASLASGLFEPIDEKHRIYRRLAGRRAGRAGFPLARRSLNTPSPVARVVLPPSLPDLVRRTMLETYAPAAVVTNRQHAALYYTGAMDRYLQIGPGEPGQDILSMAREGLRPKLREAIARAFRDRRRAAVHGVRLEQTGGAAGVTIEAFPLGDGHDDLVLVSFIDEVPGPGERTPRDIGEVAAPSELARLRQGLADTRKELNRTIHDLRRANDALKAKNEEAMSLNEEFLSTNEELESSKEELQSLNEELTTVNTQLRQTLEQQQQSSTDLSNLLHSSAVATILLDSELCIKLFNPRMRALFSLIDADIGRPLADLLPKFADPRLLADTVAARAEGTPSEQEIRAESGAWYVRSVLPYRSETGDIQGAVVTFADVSRLKEAELNAAAAREYAETIVDTVREPLVVLDPEFRVISANAAFQVAFGLTPDAIKGRALPDLGHPVLAHTQLNDLLARARQQRGIDRIELDAEQPNVAGYRVWRATACQFHAPSAERRMILLALDDITDERRIVRHQLQLVIDALPGAFLLVDAQRRIRFVSRQVGSLFGYHAEDLIGQPLDLLVPSELRERHASLHAGYVSQPVSRPMGNGLNTDGVTKDGLRIPLDIGLSPVQTADGLFIMAAIHDLRPQRRDEMQLREAKLGADRANLAKSRFLAAASHDLRQPLQTLGLLHGVLQKRVTDPEAQTTLSQADNVVAGMAELLDTFLDINQIDSGEIRPEIAELPIASVLARARDEFTPLASANGQQLRVVSSRATIRSDRQLLIRIVGNLLSNAIKYSEHGKVLLGCRRHGGTLRIEVWDTGIGIPAESIDAVFDEFYRVDPGDSSKFGLGLGLYIVRRLALLLGHTVEVRSRPGKGTMFAIVVSSFQTPPPMQQRETAEADTSRPAVLLVEDNPAQLDALRGLLELEGYRVVAARKGDEALARIRGPAAVHPDCLVADYNLPGGMTGLQVIQRVRSELGVQPPALIVSGDKLAAPLRDFAANGQMVISKPVKSAQLLAAVAKLVQMAKPGWSGSTTPARAEVAIPAAASDALIGIIDDEPGVRGALRMILEAQGYRVATYASCEAFVADPDRRRLRCLVVDLKMPGMGGLGLQNQLKSERADVPVIFVTGSGDLPLAVQAMREGAADFLQKPVRSTELLASVERALKIDEQTVGLHAEREKLAARLATLTTRERQVMERMLSGEATKNIATDLGISQRTTEHHRQNVMRKMEAKSLAMLVRMVGPRVKIV